MMLQCEGPPDGPLILERFNPMGLCVAYRRRRPRTPVGIFCAYGDGSGPAARRPSARFPLPGGFFQVPCARMALPGVVIVAGFLVTCVAVAHCATAQEVFDDAFERQFAADLVPLVQTYCVDCHGDDLETEGLNFEQHAGGLEAARDPARWQRALQMIRFKAMPPPDEQQPTDADRARLIAALEAVLRHAGSSATPDPGRVTMRRLNRIEYRNTIRDLLAVDFDTATRFPADDVGEGFDNNGDVLSLPPLLMEKYLDAAEEIAEKAIIDPQNPVRQRRAGSDMEVEGGVRRTSGGIYSMLSHGTVSTRFDVDVTGSYTLCVEAGADQAGPDTARLRLSVNNEPWHTWDVEATRDEPGVYAVSGALSAGEVTISVAFTNDYYRPDDPDPQNRDRNVFLHAMELVGPQPASTSAVSSADTARSDGRILVTRPGDGVSIEDAARQTLTPLLRRAFRRPVTGDEVRPFVRLVETAIQRGDSFQRGLQAALAAMLVSPEFLFRIEQNLPTTESPSPQPVSNYELATRLAYFIWSSMPDEALFEAAAQGGLNDDSAIRGQVARMLADPKSAALVDNFAGQWLNLRKLATVTPDPSRFEAFDESLREAMWQETRRVVTSIVREDRSLLDLLDADFTFVNERLASHYGIDGIDGVEFQRVDVDHDRRAGILTHASILTLTSNPTRTSPVKRGKWILENILGTPPPEPPPAVPALEDAQAAHPDASLRQQLEAHRQNAACAACHEQMDPLGLAFENYDAVGRWRDADMGKPVDSSGTLPDGASFEGPIELIALLRSRHEPFVRTAAEKMLTYALGRGLEFFDRPVVDRIVDAIQQQDYRFSALVVEVACSMPFRMHRGEGDES